MFCASETETRAKHTHTLECGKSKVENQFDLMNEPQNHIQYNRIYFKFHQITCQFISMSGTQEKRKDESRKRKK